MIYAGVNGLYQKWFRDYTMALTLRLGGAFTQVMNMEFEHDDGSRSEKGRAQYGALSAGLGWQRLVWRGLYIEAGLDYVQLILGSGSPPGLIQFGAGAGWRF
jgi:hypothetical protein